MEKTLKYIGLSSKEIKIYLTSLRLGSQPASIIAKHSGIYRTTVYDVFESLTKKGLANKIDKGSSTYFQVLDPSSLVSYLEREKNEYIKKVEKQKQSISEIIPALKSLERPLSTKPKIKFFEGEKGLREAYETTLEATETIRAYANVEEMHKGLPSFFPEYYKRRSDVGIFINTIAPDNEVSLQRQKNDKKELREMRLVSKESYSFSPEINIYDDKVLIASWREKMAVLIKSEEISDFHKKMFDLLWSKLG